MMSLAIAINKIKEEKQRNFFFQDTVNEMCQYDPSTYQIDHTTHSDTKDIIVYTSDRNDIIELP